MIDQVAHHSDGALRDQHAASSAERSHSNAKVARPASMACMFWLGRIFVLVLLCVLLPATAVYGQSGDRIPADQYWLGQYFAGLRLTHTSSFNGKSFSYGDCELPQGEGGCSVPAQVQNFSSCERNPIGLDRLPYRVFLVRGGGLAAEYERTGVDVGTGSRTVTVYTNEFELMGAALREIRPQSDSAPVPMSPPVYPMPVLRELKRVTVAKGRFEGTRAIARAIDLPPAEVRLRLQIAELLGPDALVGVPPPRMSTATVERLRQLAFDGQFNPARGARRHGMSVATYRAKIRRVRGLTGHC